MIESRFPSIYFFQKVKVNKIIYMYIVCELKENMYRIAVTFAVLIIFIVLKINGECKAEHPENPKDVENCAKQKTEKKCKQVTAFGLVECYWDDGKEKNKKKKKKIQTQKIQTQKIQTKRIQT